MTVTQIDDLLGDRANQTRIVFGTAATGIADVEETLRSVTGQVSGWKLPPIGRQSVYRQELTGGRPGERRVVSSDFVNRQVSGEACREAVDLARQLLPEKPGVTRSVVLVADTHHLPFWRDVLADESSSRAAAVVLLRRHDRRSLTVWAQGNGLFVTEERLAKLLQVTGGWPMLIDHAVELQAKGSEQDLALLRLADELKEKAYAREFVTATGLTADAVIVAGYRAVVAEFGHDAVAADDIVMAIELDGADHVEARSVLTCLDALQVFDREGTRLRVEPVLQQCWSFGA